MYHNLQIKIAYTSSLYVISKNKEV